MSTLLVPPSHIWSANVTGLRIGIQTMIRDPHGPAARSGRSRDVLPSAAASQGLQTGDPAQGWT
jgi:hypothetical protein